jgi:hypothetical protein
MAFMPPVSAMSGTIGPSLGQRAVDDRGGLVGAGECHPGNTGVGEQPPAQPCAVARQKRQDVARHAGLVQQLDGLEGHERRLLGRLGDHRVAGGQRRRHLAGKDGEREVPRADAHEHPAPGKHKLVALPGRAAEPQRLCKLRPRPLGVVAQEIHRLAQIGQRAFERLAGLADQQRHEPRRVLLVEIGGLLEDAGALRPAKPVPVHLGARAALSARSTWAGLASDTSPTVTRRSWGDSDCVHRFAGFRLAGHDGQGGDRLGKGGADLRSERLARGIVPQRQSAAVDPRGKDGAGERNARMRDVIELFHLAHRVGNDVLDRRLVVGKPVDERGVGAVLQQPAHQIGEQVLMAADRGVDAARPVELV